MKQYHWASLIIAPLLVASYKAAHLSVGSAINTWWFVTSFATGVVAFFLLVFAIVEWIDKAKS